MRATIIIEMSMIIRDVTDPRRLQEKPCARRCAILEFAKRFDSFSGKID
jgi:hypothetical protein